MTLRQMVLAVVLGIISSSYAYARALPAADIATLLWHSNAQLDRAPQGSGHDANAAALAGRSLLQQGAEPLPYLSMPYCTIHLGLAILIVLVVQRLHFARHVSHLQLLPAVILSQVVCLSFTRQDGGWLWQLDPVFYIVFGSMAALSLALAIVGAPCLGFVANGDAFGIQLSFGSYGPAANAATLSSGLWYDAQWAAVVAVSLGLHVALDIFMISIHQVPGRAGAVAYAWEVGSFVVVMLATWLIGGLPWTHIRYRIVVIAYLFTELFLVLLRVHSPQEGIYVFNSLTVIIFQAMWFWLAAHVERQDVFKPEPVDPAAGISAVAGAETESSTSEVADMPVEEKPSKQQQTITLEDILAVCRVPSLGKLYQQHFGPTAPPGVDPAKVEGFKVPFKQGAVDKVWQQWAGNLANGIANQESAFDKSVAILLDGFQGDYSPASTLGMGIQADGTPSERNEPAVILAGLFGNLRPDSDLRVGIMPAILHHPMVTRKMRQAAYRQVLGVLTKGHQQSLWPSIAAGTPGSTSLSLAAPMATMEHVKAKLTTVLAKPALAAWAKALEAFPVRLPNSLYGALQKLVIDLTGNRVNVYMCPRTALTSSTPLGYYVRVWAVASGASEMAAVANELATGSSMSLSQTFQSASLAMSQGGAVINNAVGPGYDVFVDESCPDIGEALVHAVLSFHGHSARDCAMAEMIVSGSVRPLVSARMRYEIADLTPFEVLSMLACPVNVKDPLAVASKANPAEAVLQQIAPRQLQHLCQALHASLMGESVDYVWLQSSQPLWKSAVRSHVQQQRDLQAAKDAEAAAAAAAAAATANPAAEETEREEPDAIVAPDNVSVRWQSANGRRSVGGRSFVTADGTGSVYRSSDMGRAASGVEDDMVSVYSDGVTDSASEFVEDPEVLQAINRITSRAKRLAEAKPAAPTDPALELLLAQVVKWVQTNGCTTAGTLSIIRQIQRTCLEAAVPVILDAVLECCQHQPHEFLADADLMCVYLEHMGIANEVLQFFGLHKFRLGRILWQRMRCDLPSGNEHALTAKDLHAHNAPDDVKAERQAAAAADKAKEASAAPATGSAAQPPEQSDATGVDELGVDFLVGIGNGMFWLVPFALHWGCSQIIGSGLFDNGRLDDQHSGWLFWAFFCAYLFVGGYFNLLLHLLNYHNHRYALPPMMLAVAQGLVSSMFVYMAAGGAVVAYAFARYNSSEMAWFTVTVFYALAMYITQLLLIYTTSIHTSVWTSRAGKMVLSIFLANIIANQISYRADLEPIVSNIMMLVVFNVVTGVLLWLHVRDQQATWAHAVMANKNSKLSRPALELLLRFHAASSGIKLDLSTVHTEAAMKQAVAAAQIMLKKVAGLRRLRLPLFFDTYCWVILGGMLQHLFITMPYWLSEWWLGPRWLGDFSLPMVMATIYVLTAGAYLEWLMAARMKAKLELPEDTSIGSMALGDPKDSRASSLCLPRSLMNGLRNCFTGRTADDSEELVSPPPGCGACNLSFAPARKPRSDDQAGPSLTSSLSYWRQLSVLTIWFATMSAGGILLGLVIESTPISSFPVHSLSDYVELYKGYGTQVAAYYMMVVGFSCMLIVRFNQIMGAPFRMKWDSLQLLSGMCTGVIIMVPVSYAISYVWIQPLTILISGLTYLGLSYCNTLMHRIRRTPFNFSRLVRMEALHTSGQSAITNTTVNNFEMAAALGRMRSGAFQHYRLSPEHQLGKQVMARLQAWSLQLTTTRRTLRNVTGSALRIGLGGPQMMAAGERAGGTSSASDANGDGPTSKADGILLAFKSAFADQMGHVSDVIARWQRGELRVFLVPFEALNPPGCPPQFYALGVPDPASRGVNLDVYVALDPTDSATLSSIVDSHFERLDVVNSIAEAMVHETFEQIVLHSGKEPNHVTAHMDACLWECTLEPGHLPRRIRRELEMLPGPVLHSQAKATPGQVARAVVAYMAALPRVLQQYQSAEDMRKQATTAPPPQQPVVRSGEEDVDPLDFLDGACISDAWLWMPVSARSMLLQLSHYLFCEKASYHHGVCLGVAINHHTVQASHALLHAVELQAFGQTISDSPWMYRTARKGSQLTAAQGAAVQRQITRTSLAAALHMEIHRAVTKMPEYAPNGEEGGSRSMRETAAGDTAVNMTGLASGRPAQPGSPSRIVEGHSEGGTSRASNIVSTAGAAPAEGAAAPAGGVATAAESAEAAWKRLPIWERAIFHLHGGLRLLWLSVMGDVSFWQEAIASMEPRGPEPTTSLGWAWFHVSRAPKGSLLKLLELMAKTSQWLSRQYCRHTFWRWPGAHEWLLAAVDRPVIALAKYNDAHQIERVHAFNRRGMFTTAVTELKPAEVQTKLRASTNGAAETMAANGEANGTPTTAALAVNDEPAISLMKEIMGTTFGDVKAAVRCATAGGATATVAKAATTTYYTVVSGRGGNPLWLPTWQFDNTTKTASWWQFTASKGGFPRAASKVVYVDVQTLEHAEDAVRARTRDPDLRFEYAPDGRVSTLTILRPKTVIREAPSAEFAQVVATFKHRSVLPARDTVLESAEVVITMLDGTVFNVSLEYAWEQPAGATPSPTMSAPHPAVVRLTETVTNNEWRFKYDPYKTASKEDAHLLFPRVPKLLSGTKHDEMLNDWVSTLQPIWMQDLLSAMVVPFAPCIWQEPPFVPKDVALESRSKHIVPHQANCPDAAVSRLLLWWIANQPPASLQSLLTGKKRRKRLRRKAAAAIKGTAAALNCLTPGKPPAAAATGEGAAATLLPAPAAPVGKPATTVPLDGLTAVIFEEMILEREQMLRPYWRAAAMLDGAAVKQALRSRIHPVQYSIGSVLLSGAATTSHLSHSIQTLLEFNTVTGNSYHYAAALAEEEEQKQMAAPRTDDLYVPLMQQPLANAGMADVLTGMNSVLDGPNALLSGANSVVSGMNAVFSGQNSIAHLGSLKSVKSGHFAGPMLMRGNARTAGGSGRHSSAGNARHSVGGGGPMRASSMSVGHANHRRSNLGAAPAVGRSGSTAHQAAPATPPAAANRRTDLGAVAAGFGGGNDENRPFIEDMPSGKLQAVAMDSGTWPMDGGGVATCRDQVVQGTDDILWFAQAEISNDLKQILPKMREQANVSTVDLVYQWDLQHESPIQSTFSALPYSQLARRIYLTTPETVRTEFLPLFSCLLSSLRKANCMSDADILTMGTSMVKLHAYFQAYDWGATWGDSQVSDMFRREMKHVAVANPPSCSRTRHSLATITQAEPSLAEMDALFDLIQHYFKVMCASLPSTTTVIQASHHGVQALNGLVHQATQNQAVLIWDHGVLMREKLIYLDSFKRNELPYFVRELLTRLHRATAHVLYSCSDLVIPCNATFNTVWERWLGTDVNRLMPLLNALDINHYPCMQDSEAELPTVSMLSHVYALKDIMSAIRAAGLIVHQYGVTDYRLDVYGSLEFDRDYVTGCHALIAELNVGNNVRLMGLGNPTKVLASTWIYLQSSISEGLPVSVIEAALCGKCVVCTNVGGCAELLANPAAAGGAAGEPPYFGRLVAPKDAAMIAYAQLEVLGMLPSLMQSKLLTPPAVDVAALKLRINDPAIRAERHALGLKYREFCLEQFQMSRYIRQQRQAVYQAHYKRQVASDVQPVRWSGSTQLW